jgi:hypothetical protein
MMVEERLGSRMLSCKPQRLLHVRLEHIDKLTIKETDVSRTLHHVVNIFHHQENGLSEIDMRRIA